MEGIYSLRTELVAALTDFLTPYRDTSPRVPAAAKS